MDWAIFESSAVWDAPHDNRPFTSKTKANPIVWKELAHSGQRRGLSRANGRDGAAGASPSRRWRVPASEVVRASAYRAQGSSGRARFSDCPFGTPRGAFDEVERDDT